MGACSIEQSIARLGIVDVHEHHMPEILLQAEVNLLQYNHKCSRLLRVLVASSALGWAAYAATPAGVTDAALAQAQREAEDLMPRLRAEAAPFPGKLSDWFGFARYDFDVAGQAATVVAPAQVAPGRPWIWHGEFFGHKPNPDLALLGRGFHVVYLSVPDMLGCPEAVRHWNVLYRELTQRYGLSWQSPRWLDSAGAGCTATTGRSPTRTRRPASMATRRCAISRAGPGAKARGRAANATGNWFSNDTDSSRRRRLWRTAATRSTASAPWPTAKVPLLHVYGDADEVVPWEENTGLVAERYRALGGDITLIAKPGVKHHPAWVGRFDADRRFHLAPCDVAEAKAWLAQHGGGPLDADGRPLIRKLGTIDLDLVETTPVVFGNRLYRFEWVREGYWDNARKTNLLSVHRPRDRAGDAAVCRWTRVRERLSSRATACT